MAARSFILGSSWKHWWLICLNKLPSKWSQFWSSKVGELQSWNIHHPLPFMAACIILFLSWFRFFIIDLMASTWRGDNQPPMFSEAKWLFLCFSWQEDTMTTCNRLLSESTLAFSRGENETCVDRVCVCLLWISANKQWCRLFRLCYHCQISPL